MTTASAVVFIALVIAVLAGMLRTPMRAWSSSWPFRPFSCWACCSSRWECGCSGESWRATRKRRRLAGLGFPSRPCPPDARSVTALTAVNIVIVLLAGYGSLHWMESPAFCGQVCHTPMQPQFTAWQDAPHGRVACVSATSAKARPGSSTPSSQASGNSCMSSPIRIRRPIPPGAEMPPGAQAQTCRSCHRPERTVGDRIRVIREYADDEANTETATVLQMHLGGRDASRRAIHWHADPAVRVEYVATDAERQTIPYVKVTDAKGQVKEYLAPDITDQTIARGARRTMDCIDCHNTVGHPISPTPEQAVDGPSPPGR